MKNKVWLRIMFLTVFSMMLSFSSVFADEEKMSDASQVVAKVNGTPVTEAELEKALDIYVPPGSFHGKKAFQKREQYKEQALEQLIETELIYQEAKRRGMTVSKKDIDNMVKDAEKKYKDKKAFEKALKSSGITMPEYRDKLARNELVKRLTKEEVEDKSKYSDKELEDYFNENKPKFLRPEGFRIKHILIKVNPSEPEEQRIEANKKAKDIIERIKAGENFSELAYNYSDDPFRVKGGDFGWVHRGRLEPEVESIMYGLEVGQTSELVETIYGYHIIRLEEKRPAEQLDFQDVKDKLRKDKESNRYKERKEEFINSLRQKAKIEIIKN